MEKTGHAEVPVPLYAALLLTSLGVLLLEITLTRIFSFTIWYHFAYLTISIALLGFGASGSVLAAFPRLLNDGGRRFLVACAALASLSVVATLLVVAAVPLDPMKVLQERSQLSILFIYYLAVTLPFFFAGLCVSGTLTIASHAVSRLYFYDLLGAGLGCLVSVVAIWVVGTPSATLISVLCFAGAAVCFATRINRTATAMAAVLLVILALLAPTIGTHLTFQPNGSKFLAQFMASAGARHVFSRWTPINRVDFVELANPDGSYVRDGISPSYGGPKPRFGMVSYDGDSCAVMYNWSDGDLSEMRLFREHILRAPYVLLHEPRALVIGVGGGADILNGLVNGVKSVVGVEINPVTVEIGSTLLKDWNGGIFTRDNVRMVAAEGRNYLRSHPDKYDLIEINGVDTLSALSTGAYVLSESYLYTADAVSDYLAHLAPNGIFAMAMGDLHLGSEIPRHSLRLASVVRRALHERGVTAPGRHVIIVASPQLLGLTHTLVKNEPFTPEEVAAIDEYAQRLGFVIWQRPDRRLDTDHATVLWGSEPERDAFYGSSFLSLRATTDEAPFFFSFYKWRSLLKHASFDPRRTLATGQVVLLIMLGQAILFSALLIVGPLLRLQRGLTGVTRIGGYLAYFVAIGLGFILLEISFIQRFTLFLGYPTYSLTVILFSLLIFTGIGSYRTERVVDRPREIRRMSVLLTVVVILYLLFLPAVLRLFLGTALPIRIAVTIVLMLPLGILMGAFFPNGVRIVRELHASFVPWGWAANGCASVVGTVLAVIMAITWSFQVVTVVALAFYIGGVASLMWALKGEHAIRPSPVS
jgi:hypothetical protein